MPAARKSTSAKRSAPKDDAEFKDVKFYNIHDNGRLPGVYLDRVEREQAEVQRAKKEDREPDLENPPSSTGTPLVPASLVPLPGVRDGEVHPNDDELTVEPMAILPVSVGGISVSSTDAESTDNTEE